MASIREHVRHLAKHNPERFAQFEAKLGGALLHRYFYRSIEPHEAYNLRKMNGPLMLILMEFLPFEEWHFTTNTLPPLPSQHLEEATTMPPTVDVFYMSKPA